MLARNPHLCGPARSPHFRPAGGSRAFSQKRIVFLRCMVYDAIYTFVIPDSSATTRLWLQKLRNHVIFCLVFNTCLTWCKDSKINIFRFWNKIVFTKSARVARNPQNLARNPHFEPAARAGPTLADHPTVFYWLIIFKTFKVSFNLLQNVSSRATEFWWVYSNSIYRK